MRLFFALLPPMLPALAFAAHPPADAFETSAGMVKITPIYHASLTIEAAGRVIYIDPWCKGGGDFNGLKPADLILITDIHPDHLDADCVNKVKQPGTRIFAPPAVAAQLGNAAQLANVDIIKNGETREWNKWTIEAIPMYNVRRGPAPGKFFHDKGRGNGYVLAFGGKRFYFSGDTEGIPEMRALKNIDVAFVCMNLPYTMPPEEAADAVKAMHPKIVYPYHYRNGDGTMSDLAVLQKGLEGSGIEVRLRDWYL
jgi:L-ascorbate metabolism protein UlaG (beta-lactamase superfamily)